MLPEIHRGTLFVYGLRMEHWAIFQARCLDVDTEPDGKTVRWLFQPLVYPERRPTDWVISPLLLGYFIASGEAQLLTPHFALVAVV